MKAAKRFLGLALCAVPASIALTELLLASALICRIPAFLRRSTWQRIPRVFWLWLPWAVLELVVWTHSPEKRAGLGEVRHLFLIAAMFLLLPALDTADERVWAWRGVVFTAAVGSSVLIGHFLLQLFLYRGQQDPVVYLRGGGLLHHWMVYASVEVLVFAALLEFWHFYPGEHRWLRPVFAVHIVAIVLSLTRILWVCGLLLSALHLIWHRSRWAYALPLIPLALIVLAPGPIRSRATESMRPGYYANAERVQMLIVGWRMIHENPVIGIGPGRVEEMYTKYLLPSEPVPAYHGHLHNNLVHLAAEFGLPVVGAAAVFVVSLWQQYKSATGSAQEFIARTAILDLSGFIVAGMADYTYGHSLALILLAYCVLAPLIPMQDKKSTGANRRNPKCSFEVD